MEQSLSFAITSDGSKTLFNAEIGEHYHSRHGAVQESKHVFLQSGLKHYLKNGSKEVSILELGFGTGLNFLMTADFCFHEKIEISYTGIEAFPLNKEVILQTAYDQYVSSEVWDAFTRSYELALLKETELGWNCNFRIASLPLMDFHTTKLFDVLYFDAFAAIHQPEMWTDDSLSHITSFLNPGGVFVTYAITGNLKRSMKSLGFTIEKIPGAPGKREMLRALKL